MDDKNELLMNADIAFENKQYDVALRWYQKVLELAPDDIYALSRAGTLCVPQGRFEEAMFYFGRTMELDPGNGDNAFNYGNACYFNNNRAKAFEMYVEAEKAGCSDDVKPRLYYQLALICSLNRDIDSALIYFKKCEDSDKTGEVALKPDLISEKLKLYMVQEDYENASKCAAQLVAINPGVFRGYMIYFSILMAHKRSEQAEKLLDDAGKYAQLSAEDKFALIMQIAALRFTKGDNEGAIQILEEQKSDADLTNMQKSELLLALAEAYSKTEEVDKAITILDGMLTGEAFLPVLDATEDQQELRDLDDEELDAMRERESEILQRKIDTRKIPNNLGMYAPVTMDRMGRPIRKYRELAKLFASVTAEDVDVEVSHYDLPVETREKVIFTLLSCYLAKDAFAETRDLAEVLKHSENKYYSYFGLYVTAMSERKLNGATEAVERKYAEAIAFFKNKTFADIKDTMASLFRARLYAEQGDYEKASEIASLLADADRQAVMEYIESCKA